MSSPASMRIIQSAQLRLEPQTRQHALEMFELLSDPMIYRYGGAAPESLEWLEARYARLESRLSPDAGEHWLNWVIRTNDDCAIGYVQASVRINGDALIAYELASPFWGRGLGHESVAAMLLELSVQFGARQAFALLHRENLRSRGLLERLRFLPCATDLWSGQALSADEMLMSRRLGKGWVASLR